MKYMSSRLLIVITILLIVGCQNEIENIEMNVPIKTLKAEIPVDGGVILYGALGENQTVENHGFILSEDSLFRGYNSQTISLDKPLKSGVFSAQILTGIKKNCVYFFKAYILSAGVKSFGETIPFNSKGSKPPKITSISPEKAHIEDTISIYGSNFGQYSYYNSVFLSGKRAYIIQQSDSLIICKIPDNAISYNVNVKVTAFDKSDSISYFLHTPIIDHFTPNLFTFRDTITIFGEHLDPVVQRNQIKLGGVVATIISSSRNKIEFVIPDDLNTTNTKIELISQLQQVFSENSFKLIPPEILSFPESSNSKQEMIINGKYFNPIAYRNKVLIENIEAEVISATTNKLTVMVPVGPFPRGFANVKIQVADISVVSYHEFGINDRWLMISNTLPFRYNRGIGIFTINNKAFILAYSKNLSDFKGYLWEFDEQTYSWTKYNLPFYLKYSGACSCNSEKGYVYTADSTNNFWEFDPSLKTWAQKADFPGGRRDGASSFSIENNIYVGIGADHYQLGQAILYQDFFQYDPLSNSWVKIDDIETGDNTGRKLASTFVINNIAYLTCGASNTGMSDSWKYDLATKIWARIADFPGARDYTTSFSLNGNGYVANGTPVGGSDRKDCWEYNPELNVWNRFYDIGHEDRSGSFSFVINNTAYIGGGGSSNNYYDGDVGAELFKLNK